MDSNVLGDTNINYSKILITPKELKEQLPLSPALGTTHPRLSPTDSKNLRFPRQSQIHRRRSMFDS